MTKDEQLVAAVSLLKTMTRPDQIHLELDAAKEKQAFDVIKQKGDRVSCLQKRRAKLLRDAECYFHEFLDKLASVEALTIEMHHAIKMLRKEWRKTLVGIADYHAADDMEIILIEAKRILEERK